MSSRYGGKIVTDGLVLCLDAHDAKSYAGEPANNLNNSIQTIILVIIMVVWVMESDPTRLSKSYDSTIKTLPAQNIQESSTAGYHHLSRITLILVLIQYPFISNP